MTRVGRSAIEMLAVGVCISIVIMLLLPAIQRWRESARRMTCQSRLNKIHVGLESYLVANDYYPAGTINPTAPISNMPDGYHHNWIGSILPDLDLQTVYDQIDRQVSVYAVENLQVAEIPLPIVRCPSAAGLVPATASNFAGVHSSIETPIAEGNDGVFCQNITISTEQIVDGLNYTLLLGEKLAVPNRDFGWISGTSSTLRNVDHPDRRCNCCGSAQATGCRGETVVGWWSNKCPF